MKKNSQIIKKTNIKPSILIHSIKELSLNLFVNVNIDGIMRIFKNNEKGKNMYPNPIAPPDSFIIIKLVGMKKAFAIKIAIEIILFTTFIFISST